MKTDNPYDPEDPRYDEYWDDEESYPLTDFVVRDFNDDAAEREYRRVYGGGPVLVPSQSSGVSIADSRGNSLILTAVDWSM